ncbi:metallophosphoesterase family protein [Mariprofundus ferrooxydans]|uniref:Calcineurin-like phosphoesterase domain-containing protein n=1 Tax=Mariprofundus ferrooxydans PV-1 TaxID=314345 RepID=Q0F2H9_9PROT|nr:metallophosphoesterase [Mariprofundus ferrooxydans]EAU55571.1 hypothetical protein SPV1_01447 [Mariprofundus ferrooxydans PV-1]KON48688.1 hypothetical protein AL013_01580 [Mariprofundus ferrooxydans]
MRIISIDAQPFHELAYVSSGASGIPKLPFFKVTVDALPSGAECLVAVSDLQGREHNGANRLLGEVVCEELALLQELEEIPAVAAVMLAGDLYDNPQSDKKGCSGDVTSVWNAFVSSFPAVIGVHGNHDIVDESILSELACVLDGSKTNLLGLMVGGVSGIIGRADRNQRKPATEFTEALQKVLRSSDLVLLHQGPDEPTTGRIGEPMVRELLERHGESLVIFGHCAWSPPYAEMGKNQLLNVDGKVMIFVAG